MMDRRHLEDALAGELERHHLHDHRNRFQHEQAADDGEHDLVLGRDRHGADHAAERERAGVAHEDRRRRRVEPQEAEAGAEHGAAQHRKLAGAGDIMDLQIIGEDRVAAQIGDHAEARRRDHHRDDGEPVESVGQVHRIAGADDDEGREQDEEPSEIEAEFLEEREHQGGRETAATEQDQDDAGHDGNDRLDAHAGAAGKAVMGLPRDFQIVVVETDEPETERDPQHDPDVGIGGVRPQQRRHQHARQDHQAAHGRRAGLGDDVRLRTIGTNRLALALQQAQPIDDGLAEQEDKEQRGDHRSAGAEGDVAKHVEDGNLVRQIDQPIEHRINLV